MTIEVLPPAPGQLPNLTGPFSGLGLQGIAFSELAMDPVTGDLAIPVHVVTGADAVIQKYRQRVRFFRGEWFLDQRLGVTYLQTIFIKAPNQIFVDAVFRAVLEGTPGVATVDAFSTILDRPTRTLFQDFQAHLVDGSTVISQASPFILG